MPPMDLQGCLVQVEMLRASSRSHAVAWGIADQKKKCHMGPAVESDGKPKQRAVATKEEQDGRRPLSSPPTPFVVTLMAT